MSSKSDFTAAEMDTYTQLLGMDLNPDKVFKAVKVKFLPNY